MKTAHRLLCRFGNLLVLPNRKAKRCWEINLYLGSMCLQNKEIQLGNRHCLSFWFQ